jgi:hypothetical protein
VVLSSQVHDAAPSTILKRVDHRPDFLALVVAASQEQEDHLQRIVPLQRGSVGAFGTVFLTAQGRGIKLATEDSKPVGSGEIIYENF